MAERSDYLYAQVRKKMLDAVRMDLIGPTAAEEALTELPTNSYINRHVISSGLRYHRR